MPGYLLQNKGHIDVSCILYHKVAQDRVIAPPSSGDDVGLTVPHLQNNTEDLQLLMGLASMPVTCCMTTLSVCLGLRGFLGC